MTPSYEGQTPADIGKFFDKISYAKCKLGIQISFNVSSIINILLYTFTAASVLRMFLHTFSEKTFKLGLHYFLKEQ